MKKWNWMEKVKVIIVEDDPIISFLHKTLIVKRKICCSPVAFLNGIEALEYIVNDSINHKKTQYLILLDLNMPEMNGWEFLNSLKGYNVANRSEVIIVTSSPDRKDREKAEKNELVSEYLEKPLIDFDPVKKIKQKLEQN